MNLIETERLTLRWMDADDAAFMLALLNDPGWLRYIGDRGVRTLAQARRYILEGPAAMTARLGFGLYLVREKAGARPVGICGLVKRDFLDDVDLGYAFLAQYCGQGYARESAAAVLDYAKRELGLRRVVAALRSDNAASARLLVKLGMRHEGMVQHPDQARVLELFAIGFE